MLDDGSDDLFGNGSVRLIRTVDIDVILDDHEQFDDRVDKFAESYEIGVLLFEEL